ncbi:hypothetical protein BDN71DRAFT_1449681 [Pleurotus eryngii]|uniref:Uncharacterized protein n=1 Tax=Pleurotus eryngii TaxID=5323 RepID=A0A9P6DFK8_PLEER|nr:hypothetical protein BDN71DRAFT_1449681 [Pleurotus eryngii]
MCVKRHYQRLADGRKLTYASCHGGTASSCTVNQDDLGGREGENQDACQSAYICGTRELESIGFVDNPSVRCGAASIADRHWAICELGCEGVVMDENESDSASDGQGIWASQLPSCAVQRWKFGKLESYRTHAHGESRNPGK